MTPTEFEEFIKANMKHNPVEAKIVRKIIRAFKAAGNPIVEVFDGEEHNKVDGSEWSIFEWVFNLDEAYLIPQSGGWVRIVLGNEWDALVDYTLSHEDTLKPVNDWIEKHY